MLIQGRYMHDIMLHRPLSPEDDPATSFLIDHDASATVSLRTYLKRHKLRSKLKIGPGPESDLVVAAAWRNPLDSGDGQSTDREVQAAEEWLEERKKAWDPRVVGMGRRWVEPKDGEKRACSLSARVSERSPD
jgi:folate-binding Fe-S cluster repair protein YgfZ